MIVVAAAGLAALWAIGALVLSALGVRREGAGGIPADFAAGAVVLAVYGTASIMLGLRLSPVYVYVLALPLAIIAWRRGGRLATPRIQPPRDALALALVAVAIGIVVMHGAAAAADRLWWDGWAIWAFKARVLFLEGTLPAEFLDPSNGYGFAHLGYPIAVPLVGWWLYSHAGAADAGLVSFAGVAWLALLALLAWRTLRRAAGDRTAALATAGIVAFWPFASYAVGGTADVVIALSLTGALTELIRAVSRGDRDAFWRAGIYLALGAVSKNEGVALAAVAIAVFVAVSEIRRSRAFAPAALAVPVAVVLPWLVVRAMNGLATDLFASSPGAAAVAERIPVLAAGIGYLFAAGPWLPVPLLALAGLAGARRHRDRAFDGAWAVLLGYLVVVCVVYLVASEDLRWLLTTSLPRVAGAVVPAVVILAVRSTASSAPVPGPDAGGDRGAR